MTTASFISIVDDDPSVREGLTDLLNSIGFATQMFISAEDFLASGDFDGTACLITDGQMSGITGFELHEQLTHTGRRIPTILITGFPNENDRARALRAGVYCYLPKPCSESDLLACLHCAIASRRIQETP